MNNTRQGVCGRNLKRCRIRKSEGDAVTLVEKMVKSDNPLNKLYNKVKAQNLFIGACKACSIKLKMKDIMESEGIPLIGDMMGHPAMSEYIEQEYQILTF